MGDEAKFDEIAAMLADLGELYARKVSPNMVGMYFVALERHSIDDIRRAINIHVRNPDTGQFFPKPADLIKAVAGDTGTQSGVAWTKVLDAIGRVGSYRSVVFDDQIIHRVITDMGGWPKLCSITEAETPFVAKDFERRYQGYAARATALDSNYPAVLVGINDAYNAGKGFATENPSLVGNSQAALAVFSRARGSLTGTNIALGGLTHENVGGTVQRLAQGQEQGGREVPAIGHLVDAAASALCGKASG